MDDFHEVSRAVGPQKTSDPYTCAENRIELLLGCFSRELSSRKFGRPRIRHTLNVTDIDTTWTESRAVLGACPGRRRTSSK
jgi:hypothetical protein